MVDAGAALQLLLAEASGAGYRFITPTPETHRRVNSREGNEEARDFAGIFGWSRPFAGSLLSPSLFERLRSAGVFVPAGNLWRSEVRIASLHGKLYLHSAYPTTASDAVFFGPDTYRFVRAALQLLPAGPFTRVLDIGCGSGAGGLAIAAERPVAELWLTDINPRALALARANALFQDRDVHTAEGDLFEPFDGEADLIVANPPYLADPEHRLYRDGTGQRGTGLSLRIVREGMTRLTPGGILFLYTGSPVKDGQNVLLAALDQIFPADGFLLQIDEIDPDVFGEELDNPAYGDVDRISVMAIRITRSA